MNEHNITKKESQEGNFWAVLVGVNKYDDSDITNLNLCVNDVKALEGTLTKLGYSVVCLHDELDNEYSPTRQNVKKKLHILSQSVQPNDLLWVHFSCHGIVTDTEKKEPVLILKDTQHLLLNDEYEVLSVAQVENYMRKSGARKLILTLDACHSGVKIGRDVSNQKDFFQNVCEKAEGFALLAAATANQKAYEFGNNGIFTHFLLKGLNSQELRENKNYITVHELYTYVLNELRKWGLKNSKLQFPTQRVEALGDIILAYYPQSSQTDDLSSDRNVDYTRLRDLLKAGQWKKADKETLAVMLKVSGREEEGRLSSESVENFPCTDLCTIDQLWVKYSNGRFGFSVQKRIWESVGRDYEEFGDAIGWIEEIEEEIEKEWWMNKKKERVKKKKWIEYSQVSFDTIAPQGHLPRLAPGFERFFGCFFVCWERCL